MPFAPQSTVVDANNPSRIGVTTGRAQQLGGTTAVEVSWGPSEREFVPEPLLKLFAGERASIECKIAAGEMGSERLASSKASRLELQPADVCCAGLRPPPGMRLFSEHGAYKLLLRIVRKVRFDPHSDRHLCASFDAHHGHG